MAKFIFVASLLTVLMLGGSQNGMANPPGGHGGGSGGGMRGGGVRGGMAMSRPAAPRAVNPGRVGPPLGTAVPRPGGPRPSPYGHPAWGNYGLYGGILGLGLYGYYDDPLWYSAGGYAYPYTDPYAYGAYPYGAIPYADPGQVTGRLRLQVKPKTAAVFVDSYYAGVVDDFDGHFQHLDLTPGPHHVEVRGSGRTSLQFDVDVEPDRTMTYRGELGK